MSYDPTDYDEGDLHQDCVPSDQVLSHVLENAFEAVRDAVAEEAARDWLGDSVGTIEVINIVSSYDREQLRAAFRNVLRIDAPADREVSPDNYFAVAADVAKFLERTRSPYAEAYRIAESVEWVADLIEIARLIREILFSLAEQKQAESVTAKASATSNQSSPTNTLDRLTQALARGADDRLLARVPYDRLNEILRRGVFYRLRQETGRPLRFIREVDAEKTPLPVFLAHWISEYLSCHAHHVDLAVCVECGKIFARERRDNVYCSKTCQNRVAYKRRKIFIAEVLRELNVRDSPHELRAGLCLNHPRFGLGVIEAVQHLRRRIRIRYDGPDAMTAITSGRMAAGAVSFPLADGQSAREFADEIKARGRRAIVDWQEIVDPDSLVLSVRFLSGVRQFKRSDIEGGLKDLTFYAAENPRLLAEML